MLQDETGVVVGYSGSLDNWAGTDDKSSSDLAVYSLGIFNLPSGPYSFIGPGPGLGMSKDSGLWTNLLTVPDSTEGDVLAWNTDFTYAPASWTLLEKPFERGIF